jgi:hypothetical protein
LKSESTGQAEASTCWRWTAAMILATSLIRV